MKALHGTGTALITPFKKDFSIDTDALGRIVEHQIANGTDYFVVLGTTGESATLSSDEKKLVMNTITEANAGRLPLVLGIGGNNTYAVAEAMKGDMEGEDLYYHPDRPSPNMLLRGQPPEIIDQAIKLIKAIRR